MPDPNISAKIEGRTPIPCNRPCLYCGGPYVHTAACVHGKVNQVFEDLNIFWPYFPDRGPYTTFDQHYGSA